MLIVLETSLLRVKYKANVRMLGDDGDLNLVWVSKLQLLRRQRQSTKKIVAFSGAGTSMTGSESVHGPFSTQGLIV